MKIKDKLLFIVTFILLFVGHTLVTYYIILGEKNISSFVISIIVGLVISIGNTWIAYKNYLKSKYFIKQRK